MAGCRWRWSSGESTGTGVDPLPEVAGSCVSVGVVNVLAPGQVCDKLVFGDLVPTAVRDPLWVVVCCGFIEGEVDSVAIHSVEFSGVAEGDVITGGENRVKCVSCGVGRCRDELFEAEVGEVAEQGGGVVVVGVLEVEVPEYVVCGCESVRADDVGDGLTELLSGAGACN
ncbi:hypothetical protein NDU88_001509 [Pleurodeles waltl]|uniref:Uncharacterized protein n=1 Tax=Pleurodeles waltl TaxID=8319 RepID=A0AAV7U8L6_PLEWA|nr:hypothetical protein NDU88_001509 [Pleurodeles waltl]